jgi:glycosyltransferase involved in cell wall biosynthesis
MSDRVDGKIRVLQVVGSMNRGGAETWIMHVLRAVDRDRFDMVFLVHSFQPDGYDDEIRALGAEVVLCPYPRNPLLYAVSFLRSVRSTGKYDVVHSHLNHFSGFVLLLSRLSGIPIRIAHAHNNSQVLQASASLGRKIYYRLARALILKYSTVGLAASQEAAIALFGENWRMDGRFRVLYCGIDVRPFFSSSGCPNLRRDLGIPSGSFVVGHVGRFHPQKNHGFLIEIAKACITPGNQVYFLLVGDGRLRAEIQQKVNEAGLAKRVLFAGSRSDVPQIMVEVMDMFVLPSHYEGLPLVGMEAQAAGLNCVLSDAITREARILPELVRYLPITDPAKWAESILDSLKCNIRMSSQMAAQEVSRTPFSIEKSTEALVRVYEGLHRPEGSPPAADGTDASDN